MTTSSRSVIRKLTFVLFAAAAVAGFQGCGARLYSNAEVRKRAVFVFPPVYDTIIAPLNDQLIPIYKRTFFIKQDIAALKDRLWDGGSNQRVMKIDDNIDVLRQEIYRLSDIKRDLLNTIYQIYPGYVTPEVVPYLGKNKKYELSGKPVILVSAQDQAEYDDAKTNEEKLSEQIVYKPLIAASLRQYKGLPDSLKKPIQPIGTPGPVPKIPPYTPTPIHR